MPERSAALALVRFIDGRPAEVLLVHPGGPFWARKHEGAWSLPKGRLEPGEAELAAARREFAEETGAPAPEGPFVPLGQVKLKSGKVVVGFGARGDFDVTTLRSNHVEVEWPHRSGRRLLVPEVDRAEWCPPARAQLLINPAQWPLLERAFAAETWSSPAS